MILVAVMRLMVALAFPNLTKDVLDKLVPNKDTDALFEPDKGVKLVVLGLIKVNAFDNKTDWDKDALSILTKTVEFVEDLGAYSTSLSSSILTNPTFIPPKSIPE